MQPNTSKAVQQSVLRRQLKLIAQSDFARDHRLDAVDGIEDFRARLPVMRYEKL